MDKKSQNNAPQENDAISEKRRKLLKTAAASGALVATLQNAGPAAAASAYGCIHTSIADSGDKWIDPASTHDSWVRAKATLYVVKHGNKEVEVFEINETEYQGKYYLDNGDEPVQAVINKIKNGNWESKKDIEVLVYYQPIHDGTGYVDATEQGPWPIIQPNPGINTELAGTCLCSMSPNMGRGPGVCEIP